MKDPLEQLSPRPSGTFLIIRLGWKGRVFVFAHNRHVRESPTSSEAYPEYASPNLPGAAMGEVLRTIIGN